MNFVEKIIEAKGSPLDEDEMLLVNLTMAVIMQEAEACIGRTIIAGLDKEPNVYSFTEQSFMQRLRETELFDIDVIEPFTEPGEFRVVILFPSGNACVENLIYTRTLN